MTEPAFVDDWVTLFAGDCRTILPELPASSIDCVVTSPPYWGLRDYGHGNQLGLEADPQDYVDHLVAVFREIRRVLTPRGTVWLNLGDSYAASRSGPPGELSTLNGSRHAPNESRRAKEAAGRPNKRWHYDPWGIKPKDLMGMPWRVLFALQADGWYHRRDIIWSKPNGMPESTTDRPTSAHEYLFLLTKSGHYYFDMDAVLEPLTSGPSDLRKMAESKPRLGGKHKDLVDPMSKASSSTNIGRKRSVGGKRAAAVEAGRDRYNGLATAEDNSRDGSLGGRHIRSVWTMATTPYPGAHFAVFPAELPERCILAGCPEGGVVLDPFAGSGTVAMVAQSLNRRSILINPDYLAQQRRRIYSRERRPASLWPR